MLKKILVPLDGSSLAEAVLPHAKRLARSFGARVTVLRVLAGLQSQRNGSGLPIGDEFDVTDRGTPKWAEYLAEIVRGLTDSGIKARSQFIAGEPSQCIVDFASRNNYDLIAMSTHGRTGITRWVYGSVADWVMHNTFTPLLLAHPPKRGTGDPSGTLRKVVVPLDGSRSAETALAYAAPIATAMGLALHLVRVVNLHFSISDELSTVYFGRTATADVEAQARGEAEEYLLGARARLLGPGDQATVIVAVGNPSEVITKMATEASRALVVMTSHARRGVGRAILGSVTENVVRCSHAPTLVLRPGIIEKVNKVDVSPALAGAA